MFLTLKKTGFNVIMRRGGKVQPLVRSKKRIYKMKLIEYIFLKWCKDIQPILLVWCILNILSTIGILGFALYCWINS